MKRILALILSLALLSGCAPKTGGAAQEEKETPPQPEELSGDLMEGVTAHAPETAGMTEEEARAVTDFSLDLFRACLEEGNTLVSPLSVISALAMTANGADGETLAQMEEAFGMPMEQLNASLAAYVNALGDSDGGRLHLANGVWFNDAAGLTVSPDFLQTNADYYGAGVYSGPFDDAARDEINAFVAEHTAGRIDRIVDELSPGAVMYLVNALSFDGIWENIYREDQIEDGVFTAADGQERDTEFMWSMERGFTTENATGIMKYYDGGKYAFIAMLPEEGVSLQECAAALTGQMLREKLTLIGDDVYLNAGIPKFSAEYGTALNEALASMGMENAFDSGKADFSRMASGGSGNLYIDRVLHKTMIRVDEKGTEAGAATAVEVRAAGLLGPDTTVCFDRPFLYMIVDCGQYVPIFVGAAADIG